LFRLVNHGKGMLQPHQITAEYNAAIPEAEREKLKDTAFEDLLRGAQVCITRTHCSVIPVMFPEFSSLELHVGFSYRRQLSSLHGLLSPSGQGPASGSM
jgi:hypothetical protein